MPKNRESEEVIYAIKKNDNEGFNISLLKIHLSYFLENKEIIIISARINYDYSDSQVFENWGSN